MTDLDNEFRELATELVDEFGKVVTFTESTLTGSAATGIVTESGVIAHEVKVAPPMEVALRFVDGDLIQLGDMRLILPAQGLDFTPSLAMKVTIDSVTHRIMHIENRYSGELIAAYDIRVRR